MTGVTGHVGGSGGVTGGTGGGARGAARYLTTHPSTRCFNGFAWSVVLRVLLLEESNTLHLISMPGNGMVEFGVLTM